MKNTPQKGLVRYIVFKEGKTWFGVALEFNIIETGNDPQEVVFLLFEAIQGYIESIRKVKGLRDFSALNQKPDKEYENLWSLIKTNKPIPSPFVIYTCGQKFLSYA